MSKPITALALAVVALAAALLWWGGGEAAPPSDPERVPGAPSLDQSKVTASTRSENSDLDGTTRTEASPAPSSFTVRILERESGDPVEGASVRLGQVTAETGTLGTCSFDARPRDQTTLHVRAESYVPQRLSIPSEGTTDGLVVWLRRGTTRRLTVLDATSKNPLPDVSVFAETVATQHERSRSIQGRASPSFRLDEPLARSDRAGQIEFVARPAEHSLVVFCKEGYSVLVLPELPTSPGPVTVELSPAEGTDVVLTDASDEPLPKRLVTLGLSDVSLSTETGRDGRCRFASGEAGTTGTFTAATSGRTASFSIHSAFAQPVQADITFPTDEPVILRDGRASLGKLIVRWEPVAGPVRIATLMGTNPLLAQLGESNAAPAVADLRIVDGAAGEAVLLRAGDVAQVAALSVEGLLRADCRGRDEVFLQPEQAANNILAVSLPGLEDATIRIACRDPLLQALSGNDGGALVSARSENGEAVFEGLCPGLYSVSTTRPGIAPALVPLNGQANITLENAGTANVKGQVYGGLGPPKIVLRHLPSSMVLHSRSGAPDGTFSLEGITCGRYEIVAYELDLELLRESGATSRIGRTTIPQQITVTPEGLSGLSLSWPESLGSLEVSVRGHTDDQALDVELHRLAPGNRSGAQLWRIRKPLHPSGRCLIEGVSTRETWALVLSERQSGHLRLTQLVLPGTERIDLAVPPVADQVLWNGPGAATLIPVVGERRSVGGVRLVTEQLGDGRWAWRNVPAGSYLILPRRSVGNSPIRTSDLRSVDVGPGTEVFSPQ